MFWRTGGIEQALPPHSGAAFYNGNGQMIVTKAMMMTMVMTTMTLMVTDWFSDSLFQVSASGAPATKLH